MTMMKKAVVSACIVLMLISACIGPAAATINIWGADSASKDSQTNDPAYNAKIAAENAQWYYDSDLNVLWTEKGEAVMLPVYLNATEATENIFGYNFTLGEEGGVTPLKAAKGAADVAYILDGAKISASVSDGGNTSAITKDNPQNVINASFTAGNSGTYAIKLTNVKLATSDKSLATVDSLSDIRGALLNNDDKVIAFTVEDSGTVPEITNITLADVDYRKVDAPDFGTIYYFDERDSATDGATNKLNATVKNKRNTDKLNWTIVSEDGDLTLGFDQDEETNTFTKVILSGEKGIGKFANTTLNTSIRRTSDVANIFNVNATHWNQSASVINDKDITGDNITFTYNVAAVPQAYVAGAGGDGWDTYVQLYPVGPYQNYTILSQSPVAGYTIKNSTTGNDKDVKNLTITASSYNGGEGPIQIELKSGINGDPNEDSIVDIIDGAGVGIETIRVASSGTSILKTAQQQFLADVDKNGRVDVADVLAIHAYIVKQ